MHDCIYIILLPPRGTWHGNRSVLRRTAPATLPECGHRESNSGWQLQLFTC
uniref:Uncharacterized protein n=1 Tax=Arundo donax TaxID=35708 RepID=A0A0A9B6Y3_ARUDO